MSNTLAGKLQFARFRPNSGGNLHTMGADQEATAPMSPSASVPPAQRRRDHLWVYVEHVADWSTLLLLIGLQAWVELGTSPSLNWMPKDALWLYSYPYKENSVPTWSVFVMAVPLPVVVFITYKILFNRTWKEVYRLSIALFIAVALTGMITSTLKMMISRFRPNFLLKCWPDAQVVLRDENEFGGFPVCAVPFDDMKEYIKSFVSGHSSVAAAGLGFLTLVMWSYSRAYAGACRPWRVFVSLVPAIGALVVAASRVMDYWHHPTDTIAGLILGYSMALLLHQQVMPWFTNPQCDLPRDHPSVVLGATLGRAGSAQPACLATHGVDEADQV